MSEQHGCSLMDEVWNSLAVSEDAKIQQGQLSKQREAPTECAEMKEIYTDEESSVVMQSTIDANTMANSIRHAELPTIAPATASSGASVVSSVSARSTRSALSIFRRKKHLRRGDDESSVGSTRSWWTRSASKKKRSREFLSFRWKKKKSGRSKNDRLVADFFDVQSLASEPDFIGSNKMPVRANSSPQLETRSVTSKRSVRTGFGGFLRKKRFNDEVAEFYGHEELSGNEISAEFNDTDTLDDEEITLGSGLDQLSLADSIDCDDDASTIASVQSNTKFNSSNSGSVVPVRSSNASVGSGKAKAEKIRVIPTSKPERPPHKSFLQQLLSRRKKRDSNLRKVLATNPNGTDNSSESSEEDQVRRPAAVHRSKSLMQGNMNLSCKSLGATPSKIDEIFSRPESAPTNPSTARLSNPQRGINRWDSDHSLMSRPMAPKRPHRRNYSEEELMDDAEEITDDSPNVDHSRSSAYTKTDSARKASNGSTKALEISLVSRTEPSKPKPTSSQSMRNLTKIASESKETEDEDDDDSVLSLLSGLLATWSAEHGGNLEDDATSVVTRIVGDRNEFRPKSILKKREGEEKTEDRERTSVAFNKIEIREYERIVGDNPSCSRGPPISIGWAYQISYESTLDDYEQLLKPPKRTKKEFHLPADKRTHILLAEWECSEEDIRKARREATYIQYCRARTSFSGSRAAAKEAAFLRKANDRTKQMVQGSAKSTKKVAMMASNVSDVSSPKPAARRASNSEPEMVEPALSPLLVAVAGPAAVAAPPAVATPAAVAAPPAVATPAAVAAPPAARRLMLEV